MRTEKYQIREHPQNMRLGNMLDDLNDVHNHFLALEKRYYRRYGLYAGRYRLQPHLTKLLQRTHKHWAWIPRDTLDQVIIRIHLGYERAFKHPSVGFPKFKRKGRYLKNARTENLPKFPKAQFACPLRNGTLSNRSLSLISVTYCITTTAIGMGTSGISKSFETLLARIGSMLSQMTYLKKSGFPLRVKV